VAGKPAALRACRDIGLGPREPCLRLRHIGSRDLADLEPVTRRLQLAADSGLVSLSEVEHGTIAPRRRVGVDSVEQHLLFRGDKEGTLGAHRVLRLADARLDTATGIERLTNGEIDAAGQPIVALADVGIGRQGIESAIEEDPWSSSGECLGHQLIRGPELGASCL
jgi:hypothetical protein